MGWERELRALEDALRNLNAQYDAFLYGASPKAPVETRRRLGQQIRRLSTTEADSSAERFRFSTLQVRYNALCERWDRLQGEKEAGRRPGIYSHFTRSAAGGLEKPPGRPNARPRVSVEEEDTRPAPSPEWALFERYREAKRERGEDVSGLDFERFVEQLVREREKLRQHFGVMEIEFDVAEREGRIRLVARPKEL
jgi:hypothetical protein